MTLDAGAHQIVLPDAPPISDLTFRYWHDAADYIPMAAVLNAGRLADGVDLGPVTAESLARTYTAIANCDLRQDVLLAQVADQTVAFNRVAWQVLPDGTQLYRHFGFVHPAWRTQGIGRALLRQAERRLRTIAVAQPTTDQRVLLAYASDGQPSLQQLLTEEGYTATRHHYTLVRPHLNDILTLPLPKGLEVRPVQPDQYPAIWRAEIEAFSDPWEPKAWHPVDNLARWQAAVYFQPDLWQVAWAGDQVAGMIRNFIDADANRQQGRQRGYTEYISVRRPWRRRGLARALLARSLVVHQAAGMTEAALGVDRDNPNAALHLYESMGFGITDHSVTYRKPLDS